MLLETFRSFRLALQCFNATVLYAFRVHQHLTVQTAVALVHERIALLTTGTLFRFANACRFAKTMTGNVNVRARLVHVIATVGVQQRDFVCARIRIATFQRIDTDRRLPRQMLVLMVCLNGADDARIFVA